MVKSNMGDELDVLVRVHSKCLTGDIFGLARCDYEKPTRTNYATNCASWERSVGLLVS